MSRRTEKSISRFCYISRSTQQLYCMDFNLGEPERICNMFLQCHARRKNHYYDFVTYPEALSNFIAWASAWVNQKGYVTCSYNVTHDGKITFTILLHIPKLRSTQRLYCMDFNLGEPERICNMFLLCHACSFVKYRVTLGNVKILRGCLRGQTREYL